MRKKKRFLSLLFTFVIGALLFSASSIKAQRIKSSKNLNKNRYDTSRQYKVSHGIKSKKSNSRLIYRRGIKDNGHGCLKQKFTSEDSSKVKNNIKAKGSPGGRYAPGFTGPPWFINPDEFPGGPSWLQNKEEGSGPWFWQAYNGHDVSDIAPPWFVNPLTAEHVPAWLHKKNGGPWWSYYLLNHESEWSHNCFTLYNNYFHIYSVICRKCLFISSNTSLGHKF